MRWIIISLWVYIHIFLDVIDFTVVTEHSRHFLPPLDSLGVVGVDILTDTHEWDSWLVCNKYYANLRAGVGGGGGI